MHFCNVPFFAIQIDERLITLITFIRFFASMLSYVRVQITFGRKAFTAKRTLIWPFTGVHSNVFVHGVLLIKSQVAKFTFIWLDTAMNCQVIRQMLFLSKFHAAYITFERFHTSMSTNMLGSARSCSQFFATQITLMLKRVCVLPLML